MEKSSCLMLSSTLHTPVSLESVFQEEHLVSDGIEHDSHVTLFYKKGDPQVPNDDLLQDVKDSLGPTESRVFLEFLKRQELFTVSDLFTLGSFTNRDEAWIVLKLKPGNELFEKLSTINKYMSEKYDIQSDFSEYTPHITLAEVGISYEPLYLESDLLEKLCFHSKVSFDDLTLSWGNVGEKNDTKKWATTKYHVVERHLREERRLAGRD